MAWQGKVGRGRDLFDGFWRGVDGSGKAWSSMVKHVSAGQGKAGISMRRGRAMHGVVEWGKARRGRDFV